MTNWDGRLWDRYWWWDGRSSYLISITISQSTTISPLPSHLIFSGIGLGVVSCQISKINDEDMIVAAEALGWFEFFMILRDDGDGGV